MHTSAAIFRDSIAISLAFKFVFLIRAFAALSAKGPPEPIAKIPSSVSITSPVPDKSKIYAIM